MIGIKRCSKCVLPENYPNITFDDNGVCNICQNYNKPQTLGEDKFKEILLSHKGKGGKYDVLVGTGGGRDSSYILWAAKKKYNLNVLALNYDNGFRHPQGLANLKRACEILNVDYISAGSKVDIQLLSKHLKASIPFGPTFAKQRMCYACMTGGKWLLHKTAIENNIPVILWGHSKAEEFSFEDKLFTKDFFGREGIRSHLFSINKIETIKFLYYVMRLRTEFWTPKTGILKNLLDIKGHVYPLNRNENVKEYFFYDYIEWDRRKIKKTLMEELDWKKPEEKISSWRFDCRLHHSLVNHCFKAMIGFNHNVDGYANMVRLGYMSRETALKQMELEEKQDSRPEIISILREELEIPDHLIDEFMSYSYTKHPDI